MEKGEFTFNETEKRIVAEGTQLYFNDNRFYVEVFYNTGEHGQRDVTEQVIEVIKQNLLK